MIEPLKTDTLINLSYEDAGPLQNVIAPAVVELLLHRRAHVHTPHNTTQ